jgi:hypothetical protein
MVPSPKPSLDGRCRLCCDVIRHRYLKSKAHAWVMVGVSLLVTWTAAHQSQAVEPVLSLPGLERLALGLKGTITLRFVG